MLPRLSVHSVEIGYLDFLTHITEEDLERYATRVAREVDLERIEQHLIPNRQATTDLQRSKVALRVILAVKEICKLFHASYGRCSPATLRLLSGSD